MYLSFFFPFALSFPLLPTFLLPPNSFFHSTSLSNKSIRMWACRHASIQMQTSACIDPRTRASIRADLWTLHGHGRPSMQSRIHPRLRQYNSYPCPSFLLFLSFAFGWNYGIKQATSILTCKGRRGHKHFEGDPLVCFAKHKFKGCIYFFMLLYSVMHVHM